MSEDFVRIVLRNVVVVENQFIWSNHGHAYISNRLPCTASITKLLAMLPSGLHGALLESCVLEPGCLHVPNWKLPDTFLAALKAWLPTQPPMREAFIHDVPWSGTSASPRAENIVEVLKCLPGLTRLSFQGSAGQLTPVGERQADSPLDWALPVQLQHLDIGGSPSAAALHAVRFASRLQQLRLLDVTEGLPRHWQDSQGTESFKRTLLELTELRVLVMARARLTLPQKVDVIEALPSLRKLQYLSVKHWRMSKVLAERLQCVCESLPIKHIAAADYATVPIMRLLHRHLTNVLPFSGVQSLEELDISDLDIPFIQTGVQEMRECLSRFKALTALRLVRPGMNSMESQNCEGGVAALVKHFGQGMLSILTNLRCLTVNAPGLGRQPIWEQEGRLGTFVAHLTALTELDIASDWPNMRIFTTPCFPSGLCTLRLGRVSCVMPEDTGNLHQCLAELPFLEELSLSIIPMEKLHECLSGARGLRRLDVSAHICLDDCFLTAHCLGLRHLPQLIDIAVRDGLTARMLQRSIAPASAHVRVHAMPVSGLCNSGLLHLSPLPWMQHSDSAAELFERYAR
jgi:hypothetical protein